MFGLPVCIIYPSLLYFHPLPLVLSPPPPQGVKWWTPSSIIPPLPPNPSPLLLLLLVILLHLSSTPLPPPLPHPSLSPPQICLALFPMSFFRSCSKRDTLCNNKPLQGLPPPLVPLCRLQYLPLEVRFAVFTAYKLYQRKVRVNIL